MISKNNPKFVTLKVVLKSPSDPDFPEFPIAAQRNLALGLVSGDKIRVKATVTNKTGSGVVNAVIVEVDPNDSTNFVENVIGVVDNGTFDVNYIISDFVPNPTLKIRFVVVSSGVTGGGGTVTPQATLYIDNLSFDKINLIKQSYDDRGRITENNNGKYNYTISDEPYQHASILPMTADAKTYFQARGNLYVSYNAFKSPIQIEEVNNDKISFDYNAMQQRSAMYYGNTNTDKLTRPYRKYFSADGSVEIKYTVATGVTEIITYIGGDAYSAPIILKSDGTTQKYFYLHRDYQSSIVAITNQVGAIVEKRRFDVWGNIAEVQDGAGNNLTSLTFIDRGYTGHEHLQGVVLINMNGRLYNPMVHRFLQPDNNVQDPYNTQNYNRYSYVLNNPLKHTDPTGEYGIGLAIGIAVAVAVTIYTLDAYYGGKAFSIQGVIKTSAIAIYTSAMTYGFGEITSTITNFYGRAAAQAVLHASFNGGMSYIQGGKFWSGFAAGGISSLASSAFTGANFDADGKAIDGSGFRGADVKVFGAQLNQSTVGLLTFGAISGGAGSLIGGGNFWQGAVTGLVVAGLNHMLHGQKNNESVPSGVETEEDLLNFIKNNRVLNKWFTKFLNKWANFSVTLANRDMGGPKGKSEGLTNNFYEEGYATVTIYRAALSTRSHLFDVILHEFGHVNAIYNGFNTYIFKTYHKFIAVAIDEVYAHSFANRFGNVTINTEYYRSFEKVLKDSNINFNKIKNLSYE